MTDAAESVSGPRPLTAESVRGRSPLTSPLTAESVRGRSPLTSPLTVQVLVHSIMHMCDPLSLLRLARCSRQLFADASTRMAWKAISAGQHVRIYVDGYDYRLFLDWAMNLGRAILRRCVGPRPWLNDTHVDPFIACVNASLFRFCDLYVQTYSDERPSSDAIRLDKMRHLSNVRAAEGSFDLIRRLPPVLTHVKISGDYASSYVCRVLSHVQPNIRTLHVVYIMARYDEAEEAADLDMKGTHRQQTVFPFLEKLIIDFDFYWSRILDSRPWLSDLLVASDRCFPILAHVQIAEYLLLRLPTNRPSHYIALDATLRTLAVTRVTLASNVLAFVRDQLPSLTSLTLCWMLDDAVVPEFHTLVRTAFDEPLDALLMARPTLGRVTLCCPHFDDLAQNWFQRAVCRVLHPERNALLATFRALRANCERAAKTHAPRLRIRTTHNDDSRTIVVGDA